METSRKIALIIEYDGTNYAGFQYQANAPSIQAELEKAVARLTLAGARISGAGRTDAGVHAKAQVAAFTTESTLSCDTFIRGLNHFLPADIAVQAAYEVPPGFDPRRHARSRTYRYTVLCKATPSPLEERYAYRVSEALDRKAMGNALRCLEGVHDFAQLSVSGGLGKSTVREILRTCIWQRDELVQFEVEANAFLRHQMRRIAGMLIRVGTRRMSIEAAKAVIEGCDSAAHTSNIPTLPPQGLCLIDVTYKDFPPYEYQT